MPDSILIVDDEENVLRALRRALADEDYRVVTASSGEQALRLLEEQTFKVLICDERMPGMTGDELLTLVSLRYPATVRILLTGQATLEDAMKAVNGGEIFRFFSKPWNDAELLLAIRVAVEKYDLDMKNRELLASARTQGHSAGSLPDDASKSGRGTKNPDGSIELPEMSDEEIAQALKDCGI